MIDRPSIPPAMKTYSNLGSTHSHRWKIRLKQDDFNNWLPSSNTHSLFFDRASKSNLGAAGAGGIIFNPNGEPLVSFEWGLWILSNNKAKALALYQGILQLQAQGIQKAMIFGDFAIIINLMTSKRVASNIFLQQTISRCQVWINQAQDFQLYHILCSINQEADKHANQSCTRLKGSLLCNNEELYQFLP